MRGKAFPKETYDLAMKLHDEGRSFQEVADVTGVPRSTIQRWVDRGQSMRRLYADDDHFTVPSDVLADRERRCSMPHRDLTGYLQGDPQVGRSALDRR